MAYERGEREPRTKCTDAEKQSAKNVKRAIVDAMSKSPTAWDVYFACQGESDSYGWGWTEKQRGRMRELYKKFVTNHETYVHQYPQAQPQVPVSSVPVDDSGIPF